MSLLKSDLDFWPLFWAQIQAPHLRLSHWLWVIATVFGGLGAITSPSNYVLLFVILILPVPSYAHCWFLAHNGVAVPRDRGEASDLIKYCEERSSWFAFLLYIGTIGVPLVLVFYFLQNPYWPYAGSFVGAFVFYQIVKRVWTSRAQN